MALNVTQSMDLAQALQTIKWMDEERRKDKTTIAALQERAQLQEQQLAQQAAQIQDLRTQLAGVQATLSKVSEFEQMVAIFKTELVLQMENREEARRKDMAESERLRRIEYEGLTAHLHRLEKDLRVLLRYDEELSGLRAETQRLTDVLQQLGVDVADIEKRIEEPVRLVTYLEEQRRADNRRITEIEQDLPEIRRRIEAVDKRFPLLEDAFQKQRTRIEAAIEETKKYEQPIEELRLSDFQREQKMKQYLDQGAQVAQELERLRSQTQGFVEQQQEAKRALTALEKFRERIERRQDDMAERQRLSEEQMQRKWEEWQTARSKEQKKRDAVTEERRRQQEQVNAELTKRLDAIPPVLKLYREQLDALWEVRRADAASLLAAAKQVHETITAPVDANLAVLRAEQPGR